MKFLVSGELSLFSMIGNGMPNTDPTASIAVTVFVEADPRRTDCPPRFCSDVAMVSDGQRGMSTANDLCRTTAFSIYPRLGSRIHRSLTRRDTSYARVKGVTVFER